MASHRIDACALADEVLYLASDDLDRAVAAAELNEVSEGPEPWAAVLAVLRDRRDHPDPFDSFPRQP